MLDRAVIDALFPDHLAEPAHWEHRYPPRSLPTGAEVTRFAPSPTGSLHIGGIYIATIDRELASRTGGAYLVRVEDTDQAREVPGALAQFSRAFRYFELPPDEWVHGRDGDYGPYQQSLRAEIYASYARDLLRAGKAYPCFATKEELADITRRQQAAKLPPGYYGSWAIWRDAAPDAVSAKLAEGAPYVVRFRAPEPSTRRVRFTDAIRGELEHEPNRNDVVILKSSDSTPRLPTYHFAHAVDDHLMRVTTVIRGEEWISSVPLHLQLFEALGFEPVRYAHVAPLMKHHPGGKRKLSKRHDPEASVDFYIASGYPPEAVRYYLRGLANGRLAELPVDRALAEPLRLGDCGVAGPLVDLAKLADICADYVATLPGEVIVDAVLRWARDFDPELADVLTAERNLAVRALAVERDGVPNPRKDLRTWSDFRPVYGYFFDALFTPVNGPTDERVRQLDLEPDVVRDFARDFVSAYQWLPDGREWFDQIRRLAAEHGFAPSVKEYQRDPAAYPGSIREASQLVRVALTGSPRSPDLHAVAAVLGADAVVRRVGALSTRP